MKERSVRRENVNLTVAIPTYGREEILIQTVKNFLDMPSPPAEILVLDQTPVHTPSVIKTVESLESEGKIRWLKIPQPSIAGSMNLGLIEACCEIVLFVDDDVFPEPGLLYAHVTAHKTTGASLIAGRVIQPWQEGIDFSADEHFHLASLKPGWVNEFIGCNFSVQRRKAIALGGFDENFVRVAYRYEAEFAHRWIRAGEKIYFEPSACIHHLKVKRGGTRSFGDHLTTFKPDHAVGAYYYIFQTWVGWKSFFEFLYRPLRSVVTRHHLRHPWWIPATFIAEISGICWAFALHLRGPRYMHIKKNFDLANK